MAIELEPTRASQDDLRRLYLLAALVDAAEGSAGPQDSKAAAESIEPMFPDAPNTLREDIKALAADILVHIHDSLAADPYNPPVEIPEATVETINKIRQRAKASSLVRTAVLAPLVLGYMLEHPKTLGLTSTPTLREVGFTLLGEPLPDGSVEETLDKLWQFKLITGPGGHGKRLVKPTGVTPEGYERFHGGDSILLPSRNSQVSSSVYNTTNNIGQVQGQNVAVGNQGQVQQTANLEINPMADDLYKAVEQLQEALAGHPDEQHEADSLLQELDQVKQSGDRSKLNIVAAKAYGFAKGLAGKVVDTAVTSAVATVAQGILA